MFTTAVILAGGLGTRLRSVVTDRPKVLAPVQGKPFITYILDQLAKAGIEDVILCTGYLGEQVKAALGESYGPLDLKYSQEIEPLGTGGAVRMSLPLIKTDPLLVMNGDSYCEADLQVFCRQHQTAQADASLLLVPLPDTQRYGRVDVEENGCILRFNEKGQSTSAGWINAGIYLLSRRFLQAIPADQAISLEKEVFPAWIGRSLYGFPSSGSDGRFLDIGIPEDYAVAEEFFHP